MSNTGNWNTGDWNTGDSNTGNCNTGNRNTGNWNTGDWNTGDSNTGNCNTGNRNTGNWNTGDWNTGNWNTGNWNTGNWNQCDNETGFFNTEQSGDIRIFNNQYSREKWNELDKPSFIYFCLTEWISQSDMTEKEMEENPSYKITEGYLKEYEYKEAFKKSYDAASNEDKKKVFNLPNFDAKIFKEISGIDVTINDNTDKIEDLLKAQKELLSKAEEIKKQIEELK